MTPEKFIKYVKKDVEKIVKFNLVNNKTVKVECNVEVDGFFDGDELAVATDKPKEEWFPILVHEYAHFQQWRENSPAWNLTVIDDTDIGDYFFLWISRKKKISKDVVRLSCTGMRDLEVDCEKRTVSLIRRFKLPINISEYIMQANAYLYFYNYALLKRKWWEKGHAPYRNPDVWKNFPSFFLRKYSQLPKKYIELYDKYC